MAEKIITFRVDEHIKKAFEKVARDADLTTSQMLRHFMREVVENEAKTNAQQSLLEPLKKTGNTKSTTKKISVIPESWRAK